MSRENTAAPANPIRYIRRWPWRSPSFPAIGVNTAKASRGPAITHVTTDTLESRSSAMVASAAESTVIVNELHATPVRATI